MPVTKSAKKKQRVDVKRTLRNQRQKELLKKRVRKAQQEKTRQVLRDAISLVDKAVKAHLIHKNKGAHIKSVLSKSIKTHPFRKAPSPKKKTQ